MCIHTGLNQRVAATVEFYKVVTQRGYLSGRHPIVWWVNDGKGITD